MNWKHALWKIFTAILSLLWKLFLYALYASCRTVEFLCKALGDWLQSIIAPNTKKPSR